MFWWWTISKLTSPLTRDEAVAKLVAAQAVKPLVRTLAHSDVEMALEAAAVLKRIGRPAAPALIAALGHGAPQVRRFSAEVLGKIGDAAAAMPLTQLLSDYDEFVRLAAVQALGRLKSQAALPVLLTLVYNGSDAERAKKEAVVKAIGAQHPESLESLLQDKDRTIRSRAASLLGKFATPAGIIGLGRALQDTDFAVRSGSLDGLLELGAVAVPQLLKRLPLVDDDTQPRILDALVKIGDKSVAGPLLAVLPTAAERLRGAIVSTLGELRDPGAVDVLIPMLETEGSAAIALGQIGDRRATIPLNKLLQSGKHEHFRVRAAKALRQIADPAAVDALVSALDDPVKEVRRAVAEALGTIADTRAVEALLVKWRDRTDEERPEYAEALGRIGDGRAVDALVEGLLEKDYHVRKSSVAALRLLRDKRAVKPLMNLIGSEEYFRDEIAEALAAIGDPVAIPALAAALAKGMGSEATKRTQAALRTLQEKDRSPVTTVQSGGKPGLLALDSGVTILKFPTGGERKFDLHLRLIAALKGGGGFPALTVHAGRPKPEHTELPHLIILRGTAAAISAQSKVYYTPAAEDFVRRECGGDWQAISATSSLSNVAAPGTTVDLRGLNASLQRINLAHYDIEPR